ncbi:MAG: hypothetical protein DMG74_02375 [Acidobacteria bacterium]|nr:MAG: hypothetical protein DMG74_02375 [Acidobacteriota bacterium]
MFREVCRRLNLPFALAVGALLLSSPWTGAQVAGLHGTITGPSGAPVPNARISIKNLDTNNTTAITADVRGSYSSSDLPPGNYSVTVSMTGFLDVTASIAVTVGKQSVLNFTLQSANNQPGHKTPATSSMGGVVSSETVRDMPVNGRDWTQAATLQAGVSSVRTQPDATNTSSGRGQRGFGAQISVSGGRPQQNNYLLDGITINDYANAAPGSVLGLDLGADAVEEFSVVTSNYPATYGRSSGGVINAVTRSGSNAFHGTVYEFLRNSALDARNFFDVTKPPFRRNQFGASAGAPIQKDRAFFFANYEGLRQSLGTTQVDTVLSPAARSGQLSSGNVTVDSQVAPYLAFYPLPNGRILPPGDTGIFTFSGQQVTREDYFTTRLDRKFSEHDTLSGTYVFDTAKTIQPDKLDTKLTGVQSRRQLFTLLENHTFGSQLVNSFRLGFNRVVALLGQTPGAINPLAADVSLGFLPGHTAGGISVLELTDFPGGLGANSVFNFHWNSIQAYDDIALNRGNHSLRFGLSLERIRNNTLAESNPNGVFTFQSISDFLTDFRWYRNFTVNLGIRYEMATVPSDAHGRLATMRRMTDPLPHLGDPYFSNPTLRNFEPRLGLAWDPLGNGKVAIRSGFGMFDVLPLPYEFELLSLFAAPFFQLGTPTNLPADSFPLTAVSLASADPRTLRNVYVQPDPSRNYVMQWNLNVELDATKNSTALIGYVGSRGVHQPFRVDDGNIVLPQLTPAGYLWPASGGQKLNPIPPLDHHAVFDELGNPVSGAGLINSTQTPSRQVQLGLKLIW